jgi:long-chain fatty acid transport protein
MRNGWQRYALVAMGASLSGVAVARGGGIEVPMQSARAAGQADAFTAQADDPSAIFYNPAGLTQLRGTNLSAGAYLLQADWNLNADNGNDASMHQLTVLPHFYIATDFGLERWRFGIGVNNVHGLDEDWGDTGPLRTIVDEAKLSVINIAPTVAYKVTDQFSLGMAINVYYGSLELTRNVPLGAPPTPEGQFDYSGNDLAFGVTPGVLWKINDRHALGAYYRSPFSLDFDGDASVKLNGNALAGPSDTEASLDFPQSIGVGYAFRPVQPLKLEANVIWTDWEAVDEVLFTSDNAAFNGQTLPADWDSGFTYRLGAEYQVNPKWALRTGYAYSETAVPDATFSPIVPDSDYHLVSIGTGYATARWGIDVAAQYIHRETHSVSGSVNSPAVDGEWRNNMFGLMATLSLKL